MRTGHVKRGTLASLVIFAGMTVSTVAPAADGEGKLTGYVDGEALYYTCTPGNESSTITQGEFGYCMGVILGVVDYIKFRRTMDKKPSCLPAELTPEALRDMVVSYLDRNPQERAVPAAASISHALADAFPKCAG